MRRILIVSLVALAAGGISVGSAVAAPTGSTPCVQAASSEPWCWCHGYRPCWQCWR
jgi:hypothetical protein